MCHATGFEANSLEATTRMCLYSYVQQTPKADRANQEELEDKASAPEGLEQGT